jgi:hypothetical protein
MGIMSCYNIDSFESHETSRVAMVVQLKYLFVHVGLCTNVIMYVNNTSANLITLTIILTTCVICYTNVNIAKFS